MKSFKEFLKEDTIGTSDHTKSFYGSDEKAAEISREGSKIHPNDRLAHSDELSALKNYARSGHDSINKYHRQGEEEFSEGPYSSALKSVKEDTNHLDSLLNKHKTQHDLHVWRGVTISGAASLELGKHKEFHDKGYVSTSLDPSRSHRFISGHSSNPDLMHNHIMHIKVPAGAKALYVPKYNHITRDEQEVLLPRGSKFRHEGSETHKFEYGKITVHHLTHIPEES